MRAIVNLRTEPRLREEFEYAHVLDNTVLIDRRTRWGNPFTLGKDGSRDQVIARYRSDLWRRIRAGEISLEELAELDGCWLACWWSRCPVMAMCWQGPRRGRPKCWPSARLHDAFNRRHRVGMGVCPVAGRPGTGLYSAGRGRPRPAPRSPLRGLRPSGDDP